MEVLLPEGWKPPIGTIWESQYRRGFVQFWEMTDDGGEYWPASYRDSGFDGILNTADDVVNNSTLRKIVVPDEDTLIWKIAPLRISPGFGPDRVFLFCADMAGHLYVYSIEDILDMVPPDPNDVGAVLDSSYRVASWTAPMSLLDDMQTNIFDVAIDHRPGGNIANVYVAVRRVGVVILQFSISGPQIDLTEIERIQTPGNPTSVFVREDAGTYHLLVNDNGGGIRVYGEE